MDYPTPGCSRNPFAGRCFGLSPSLSFSRSLSLSLSLSHTHTDTPHKTGASWEPPGWPQPSTLSPQPSTLNHQPSALWGGLTAEYRPSKHSRSISMRTPRLTRESTACDGAASQSISSPRMYELNGFSKSTPPPNRQLVYFC